MHAPLRQLKVKSKSIVPTKLIDGPQAGLEALLRVMVLNMTRVKSWLGERAMI